jgi:hypothetical protein
MTQTVVPWAKRAGFASRTGDGRFIGPFNPALLSPVIGGAVKLSGTQGRIRHDVPIGQPRGDGPPEPQPATAPGRARQ